MKRILRALGPKRLDPDVSPPSLAIAHGTFNYIRAQHRDRAFINESDLAYYTGLSPTTLFRRGGIERQEAQIGLIQRVSKGDSGHLCASEYAITKPEGELGKGHLREYVAEDFLAPRNQLWHADRLGQRGWWFFYGYYTAHGMTDRVLTFTQIGELSGVSRTSTITLIKALMTESPLVSKVKGGWKIQLSAVDQGCEVWIDLREREVHERASVRQEVFYAQRKVFIEEHTTPAAVVIATVALAWNVPAPTTIEIPNWLPWAEPERLLAL